MKLKPEQLANNLSKNLLPVYIVSGDVPLIIQESCDEIRHITKNAGFTEREVLSNETGFDWQKLIDSGNTLSLFGEKKIIELKIPTGKPGDKGSKAICAYLENPSPDNILLISSGKLDAASQRSKWFKAIDKVGAHIQVWPVDINHLPRWIQNRAAKKQLKLDAEATQILAEKVEGNLLAAAQEIEKLALLHPEASQLSSEDIIKAVTNSARYDFFSFLDKTLEGNTAKAITMLRGLREEGTEATIILWGLTRELRQLSKMAEDLARTNIGACLQKHRVWDKRKPIVSANLKRNSKTDYQLMIKQAALVDKSIKGLSADSSWDLLERLTLSLSGVKTPA